MTTVTFYKSDNLICGFDSKGHSGYAKEGEDIVCSAISSATIMTANTITEIMQLNAEVTCDDGYLSLILSSDEAKKASDVLDGLKLHLTALSEQYNKYLKVKISEV